ncbi:MAG: hypothetical protein M1820_004332, partial [Bogoriella megaspora]
MAVQLLQFAVFRKSLTVQDDALHSLSFAPSWTLEDLVQGTSGSAEDAEISQTICTALQVSLIDLFRSWNILPSCVLGHSSGEIAAAYAAGAISREEAVAVAYCRGRALAKNSKKGSMLAVGLSAQDARKILRGMEHEVKVAAINSPTSVTLSGDAQTMQGIEAKLQGDNIFVRKLNTGGNAYHSHHMVEIAYTYEELVTRALEELKILALDRANLGPRTRWISTTTPQIRMKERSEALESIIEVDKEVVDILIEIGPHPALQTPVKQIISGLQVNPNSRAPLYIPTLKRANDGMRDLLNLCGALFCLNYPVDLVAMNSTELIIDKNKTTFQHGKVCIDLPPYRYAYGPVIYRENRIASEIRNRKYLRHDLLGALQPGCARDRPSWRNILRVKDVPWLKHHRLRPHVVLPGSAY